MKLNFREPQTVEDALDLVTTISIFLDLWIGRKEDWRLAQLMATVLDKDVWKVVARCVVTKSGVSLEHVSFKELKTKGMMEALMVFCYGIEELELADIYAKNYAGLEPSATLGLLRDIQLIKEELKTLSDPSKVMQHVISRAIAKNL